MSTRKRYWKIGLVIMLVVFMALGTALIGLASDPFGPIYLVNQDFESGEFGAPDPSCDWLVSEYGFPDDCDLMGVKINDPITGNFEDQTGEIKFGCGADEFEVDLTINGGTLDFSSPYKIYYVWVKAGPGGNLYGYPDGTNSETGLISPQPSISHVTFYFCEPEFATKSGYKFHDLNANGVWDDEEPALSGWTINLWTEVDGVLAIVDTEITDEYGYYEFDELMPGVDYFVSEVIKDGWIQSYPNEETEGALFIDGVGFVWGPINLESGEAEEDNNFGNYRPAIWADETAWAYGGELANPNWDYVNNRFWGWTNGPLTEDEYEWDIYAGAGQNDLTKGQVVGTLYVEYLDGTVTVTYQLDDGFYLGETHLWVGDDVLPMVNQGRRQVYTNAPGQFPYGEYIGFEAGVKMVNEWTWRMDGFEGEIYVAAHSVVWMEVEYEEW